MFSHSVRGRTCQHWATENWRRKNDGITNEKKDGEWKSKSSKAIIALNENTIMLSWSAEAVDYASCLMHNEFIRQGKSTMYSHYYWRSATMTQYANVTRVLKSKPIPTFFARFRRKNTYIRFRLFFFMLFCYIHSKCYYFAEKIINCNNNW